MVDFLGRVNEEQDALRKLIAKVPGFSGYVDRQNRRLADKLLRETAANHFEQLWQGVGEIQREMIKNGNLDSIDDVETAALKLRQFIDRVKTAAYGYAGFFDAVKINAEELASLYDYDLRLLELEGELQRAIDNVKVSSGTDGLPAAIRHLNTLSTEAVALFDKRQEVILQSGAPSSIDTSSV